MMRILITGSCGFIFSNVVNSFLQETDYDLVSIDALTYAASIKNVIQAKRHKLYVGNVCDKNLVNKVFEIEKPDYVIHGAAESMVDRSITGSDVFIQTNVLGTHVMLDAALRARVKKFINVSTDEVYSSIKEGSYTEKDPLKPTNPYSASKASADLLGQSFFHQYGLPVITTRCCNVFGPRQHTEKFIPKVIYNSLHDQKTPVYGRGDNVREWIYVKDKFYALKTLLDKGAPGEVYNISSSQERTNMQVVREILKTVGKGEDLIEYVKDRPGHDFRYSVSSDKLRALGWKPQYDFEEALRYSCGWYKANGSWFWKK